MLNYPSCYLKNSAKFSNFPNEGYTQNQSKSQSTNSLQNAIIGAINQYQKSIEQDEQQAIVSQPNSPQKSQTSHSNRKHNPQNTRYLHKKQIKPLRMFKDKIDLSKQNSQKHTKIKQLILRNQKLKQQYRNSLDNNYRLQHFLKAIQFTFKNDECNQRANQTLLKAKKNLQRQQKQSKEYIAKIWKKPKYNCMKQLKMYIKLAKIQQEVQINLYQLMVKENEELLVRSDLNGEEEEFFGHYRKKIMSIMETMARGAESKQEEYKKEKLMIKIHLLGKEIGQIHRDMNSVDNKIKSQLLQKQGIEYQLQILKNRTKQKHKKLVKQAQKTLSQKVKTKKLRILELRKEYKEKSKTNQYISKWTKQLKVQLQKLKENHSNIKQHYDIQINQLSTQIQKWNRKYKAELVEDQVLKKTSKNNQLLSKNKNKEKKDVDARKSMHHRQSILGVKKKSREVRREEIDYVRKILIFGVLGDQRYETCQQFIQEEIIKNRNVVTAEQIRSALLEILGKNKVQTGQLDKLIRYIMQDNQLQSPQKQKSMQSKLCLLITKNLLVSELTSSNLPVYKQQIHDFMQKNYDNFRQNLWESSGKTLDFSTVTLETVIRKYIVNERQIICFLEYFEYCLWVRFATIFVHRLVGFQMVCEDLLGRKLVKEVRRERRVVRGK